MKPYYKQAFIVFLFFLAFVFYYYNNSIKQLNWIILLVLIILVFIFINSFFDIIEPPSFEKQNKYKRFNEYTEDGFKSACPARKEEYIYISWDSIEAIFLSNRVPGDGEYHNFQYIFVLNREPVIINKNNPSLFTKIVHKILPEPKKSGLPIYTTDDNIQRDFHYIGSALEKYFIKTNENLKEYLSLKFGNKIEKKIINNTVYYENPKNLKQYGFYKIFDRNNNLNDETLNRFREESKNN
jgi:hypothetical protein